VCQLKGCVLLLLVVLAMPDLCKASSLCDGVGPPPSAKFGPDDWSTRTPLEHLNYLKAPSKYGYTVWGCKEGWVKESDIPALMKLLDSGEECSFQTSAKSAVMHTRRSTVGNEAAWLIESFRVGMFPPNISSAVGAPSVTELRKWWAERSFHPPLQPPNKSLERTRER
jgi:hypothetical protein